MQKVAQFEKVSWECFKASCDNKEIYQKIKLPLRATSGSAGYDFFAPYSFLLKPGETITIPTGIRVKINDGWFLSIYPRSGLGFKYRLRLNNTVGIIDSDYYYALNEGHIFIKITNESNELKELQIDEGFAFAQGIFLNYGITFDDNVTSTRLGGIGSTSEHEAKNDTKIFNN